MARVGLRLLCRSLERLVSLGPGQGGGVGGLRPEGAYRVAVSQGASCEVGLWVYSGERGWCSLWAGTVSFGRLSSCHNRVAVALVSEGLTLASPTPRGGLYCPVHQDSQGTKTRRIQ